MVKTPNRLLLFSFLITILLTGCIYLSSVLMPSILFKLESPYTKLENEIKDYAKKVNSDTDSKQWQTDANQLIKLSLRLAMADWKIEEYDKVITRLEPLLPIIQKLNDKNLISYSEYYLATAYNAVGINDKAKLLLEVLVSHSTQEFMKIYGAETMARLGGIYLENKDYSKAESVIQKIYTLAKNKPEDMLEAERVQGSMFLRQRKFKKAEAVDIQALKVAKDIYDKYDPRVIPYIQALGLVYLAEKRYNEAEALYKSTLNLLTYGNTEVAATTTYHNLGLIYHAQRDYIKAKYWYDKAFYEEYRMGFNLKAPKYARVVIHLKELKAKQPPSFIWDS